MLRRYFPVPEDAALTAWLNMSQRRWLGAMRWPLLAIGIIAGFSGGVNLISRWLTDYWISSGMAGTGVLDWLTWMPMMLPELVQPLLLTLIASYAGGLRFTQEAIASLSNTLAWTSVRGRVRLFSWGVFIAAYCMPRWAWGVSWVLWPPDTRVQAGLVQPMEWLVLSSLLTPLAHTAFAAELSCWLALRWGALSRIGSALLGALLLWLLPSALSMAIYAMFPEGYVLPHFFAGELARLGMNISLAAVLAIGTARRPATFAEQFTLAGH